MSDRRIVERALDIARSGKVSNATQIRRQLAAEGFTFFEVAGALDGRHMQGQLRAAIKAARGAVTSA